MYHKIFRWFASLILALTFASAGYTPALAAPLNDNFSDAEVISSLPFLTTVDITGAMNESGEPQPCISMPNTVWYSFTATEAMVVRATLQGSMISGNLNVYTGGPGMPDLQFLNCTWNSWEGPPTFSAVAGQTYYLQVGGIFGNVGTLQVNLEQVPPPPNDNFIDATTINSLPFTTAFDNLGASFESGEPIPSCAYSAPPYRTIWFVFTTSQDGLISASFSPWTITFNSFTAVYKGSSLDTLENLGCSNYSNILTFYAESGQTYYIQLGGLSGEGGTGTFVLENTPPPKPGFSSYPWDPTRFDTIQFNNSSYDPVGIGIQSAGWDFGDGMTYNGNDYYVFHQYAADGDYAVTLTVTTYDERTASLTQTLQVRTHDVAVTKISAPKSANVGQIREIVVSVRNYLYPETVRVELYRSVPGGGFESIATSSQYVPVRSGTRTTPFSFNYTFSPQDAQLGKVVFWAVATIVNFRDALPADNEAVSPPTKVAK